MEYTIYSTYFDSKHQLQVYALCTQYISGNMQHTASKTVIQKGKLCPMLSNLNVFQKYSVNFKK